ncbi:SusC/RagA family TonB-linked outer membrane protein [Sunxiuqinia sp. A32]|uniref:SusC/RagA family TonB-linked outer membrane protein n=1 Tax=Sunxiuqinia sp. A32 TaxID=3461496 RepID=UPI0040454DBF
MMRLMTFIVLVSVFVANANTASSQVGKLNLSFQKASLTEVFERLEQELNIGFLLPAEIVNDTREINLSFKDANVETILKQVLDVENYRYEFVGKNVVITKKQSVQQSKDVTGKITDNSGFPLPGVTVVVKGTTQGTITDVDGNYSLSNVNSGDALVFSFVGMKSQEILVAGKATIDVIMEEDAIGIEEVVAIGYGTMRKTELTSAVSNVSSEDFVQGAIRDAGQLIQGKVAGLSISQTNSNPVGESQISLRGITTLKSGTSPLVIIDGVPGSLTMVAPQDIESIDVLKDGSAAAIYGTRGTNGVILITTKGVTGEIKNTIEIDSYISTQVITKKLDFMNANQYRELVNQGKPGAIDYGGNTNWLDEILQTPISHESNLNLKGGNISTNYIANLNYKELEGILKKSDNQSLTTRIEVNHTMYEGKLKINANLLGKQSTYFSGADGNSFRNDVYRNALIYNPTDPIKDENEVWTEHISMNNYRNPLALIEETDGEIKEDNIRTFGTIMFTPTNSLIAKLLLSRNKWNSTRGYSETKKHISTIQNNRNGFASRGSSHEIDDLAEFTLQYDRTYKDHNFKFLGGYSWQNTVWENYFMNNWDFPSDEYSYNNMEAGQALSRGEANMGSYKSETRLIGYFFRINYNYKNRYLLMASIRHEGSSKFGADHKWGNFPAISAGWNVREESFLDGATWMSNLKIRAGFGVTGTIPGSPYMSLSRLKFSPNAFAGGQWIPTVMPSTNPNPDLRWEKKEEINIGLDFGLFDDKITGSIDAYKRTTKDMLWDYNVSKPPYLYSTIVANAGTMENMGLEVHLSFVPIETNQVMWTSTINYSTNKNTLKSLSNDQFTVQSGYFFTGNTGEPIQQSTHRVAEGEPIGNFYGYKTIDIDDEGRWIIEGEDGNPKSILDQKATDKKVIGNGIPKHIISWDNMVKYKNFDMSLTMRGAFGYDIFNFPRLFYAMPVSLTRGNVFSTTFDNVYDKRPIGDSQSLDYVSYFIEKGDFLKIDNLTVGYNKSIHSEIIKHLRVYFSCNNLATFTNYSGIDPEVNTLGLSPGIDGRDRYPSARTYSLGVKMRF